MEMFGDEGRDVRIIQHILAEACVVMKSEGCSWTVTLSYRKWAHEQKYSLDIVFKVDVNDRQGGDIK